MCLRGLGELLLPGLRGPAVGPSGARLGASDVPGAKPGMCRFGGKSWNNWVR